MGKKPDIMFPSFSALPANLFAVHTADTGNSECAMRAHQAQSSVSLCLHGLEITNWVLAQYLVL